MHMEGLVKTYIVYSCIYLSLHSAAKATDLCSKPRFCSKKQTTSNVSSNNKMLLTAPLVLLILVFSKTLQLPYPYAKTKGTAGQR